MSEEFQKQGDIVSSSKGFAVKLRVAGGVLYRDSTGEYEIDTEWLVKPPGIILYKGSRGNKGFHNLQGAQIDDIFSNAARALSYLGYKAEIWSSPSGPEH